MKDYTGHTIVNGELHHASVSGVKSFDIRTKGGCPRRWAYRKVFGVKTDDDMNAVAKDKGTALDVELKHYLRTGDKTLSGLALKGLHILEAPGPDLGLDIALHTVEHYEPLQFGPNAGQLAPAREPFAGGIDWAPGTVHKVQSALTADGVPFVGELDLAHARGHYRDDEGEYHDDPPGTVEVADIKFKTNATDRNGNSLYFLPTDMIRDVQMSGYGEWVRRVRPETTHIRLSMLYFPEKKGLPTKVTRLHVIDEFPKAWARTESVVREMKDVARATDIEQVPGAPDISTCDAYSGCPHRGYCTAYKRNSLDKTYGKMAEDHANNSTGWSVEPAPQPQVNEMGLLANQPGIMNQQRAAEAGFPAQPDMRQQLATEEAAQRASVAQQQQQMAQPLNAAELLQVCMRLNAYGYGFPTLAGNAAQGYAVAGGQNVAPGTVYPGQPALAGARRSLHGIQLTEVSHIYQLEGELSQEAAQAAPAQVFVPPPVQQPAMMQTPAVQFTQQPQMPQGNPTMSFLPPDAPQSMPQLAMQGGPLPGQPMQQYVTNQVAPSGAEIATHAAATQAITTGEVSAPRRAGRPKNPPKDKSQDAAPGSVAASAQAAPSPSSQPATASQAAPVSSSPSALDSAASRSPFKAIVLVNCRTEAFVTQSLEGYIDYINRSIAEKYNVGKDGKPGVLDVRTAVDGSVLGFGGWKGAVRTIVPVDQPSEGLYHIETHRDELREAVVDGLRQAGWIIVRGTFS